MNVIISESQLKLLEAYVVPESMKDRIRNVDMDKDELENYIEASGEYMVDITNGKTYLVQYLKALSDLIGRKYAVCAPVEKDGTYGAFYVKPYSTFQKKESASIHKNTVQMQRKPNLYQQMGLNK